MNRPSVFNAPFDPFEGFMEEFFRPLGDTILNSRIVKSDASKFGVMSTDIEESESEYTLLINLPGFSKEDITIELEDGYLTVSAKKEIQEENYDKRLIRKERYTENCSRKFLVGDDITEDDIKASNKDGVLKVVIPKKKEEVLEEKKKYISID